MLFQITLVNHDGNADVEAALPAPVVCKFCGDHVTPRVVVSPPPPKPNPLEYLVEAKGWRLLAESIVSGANTAVHSDDFAGCWITSGRVMREQIADDGLLCKMLWYVLPRYQGGPLVLYRGENINRWKAGELGFAWTERRKVAEMFGRGLNAVADGGVLLRATVDPGCIISGPVAHSSKLGEHQFTVDPFSITGVEVIAEYPPC